MPSEVQASVRHNAPLVVIDLTGDVTTFADEEINRAYREVCEQGAENILLNFARVDYVNSAGVSTIIGILGQTREADQRLLITGLTPHYQKIFQIMGLTQYVPIFPSEEEAIGYVKVN